MAVKSLPLPSQKNPSVPKSSTGPTSAVSTPAMPRHQPRYSEGSDEDLASVASRSNSDGESRDIAVHSNSRKKKKRLRRHPTARDRAVTKRRKQLPHRLSSRRHNSSRRRNEESLNVQDSSVESEHEKGSHSSFASDSDASSQNSSDSETEGSDGGDIALQDELVDVPDLDVTAFDSWDALESYLKAYSRKTFQIYTIRTNTPVRTRNARMQRNMSAFKPVPDEFKFYNKTYDFEGDSLNPVHIEDHINRRGSHDAAETEDAATTSSDILSKTVVLSESGQSSEDVTQSQSGQELEPLDDGENSAESEKRPSVRPRWMISKTTNKSDKRWNSSGTDT